MALKNQKNTKTQETKPAGTVSDTTALEVAKKPNMPVCPANATYTETWMMDWLTAAADATNAIDVCKNSGTTISEYLQGRIVDEAFDTACRIFDQIVELRIIEMIRKQAAEGDARAQGMYFKEVRRPAFTPDFASWNALPPSPPTANPLPAEIADAMVAAGLAAYESLKRPELPNPERRQLPSPS